MDVDAGPEQGPEEPEALQVIEVQVGQQDVELVDGLVLHRHAEGPQAGAGVEHEDGTVGEAYLHTRRVAAVAHGVWAGRRQRAACPPDARLHQLVSQKTVTTPCMSSEAPKSGYAVTSTLRRTPS